MTFIKIKPGYPGFSLRKKKPPERVASIGVITMAFGQMRTSLLSHFLRFVN